MLSRKGTLLVLQEGTFPVLPEGTLPVVHPLQYSPLSDRRERLAKTYRLAHTLTRTCYGYWRLGRLHCRSCLCRRVDVSNKIAFEISWFKVIQWNNCWTTSDIKRISLVSSLQDTVSAFIRRLKQLTNSVVMYKHMRCAAQILAYVFFALGLLLNGSTPQLLHGYFQLGNVQ